MGKYKEENTQFIKNVGIRRNNRTKLCRSKRIAWTSLQLLSWNKNEVSIFLTTVIQTINMYITRIINPDFYKKCSLSSILNKQSSFFIINI